MGLTGGCYCGQIRYQINALADQLRTSLCHCDNCKKWCGSPFQTTVKTPRPAFQITAGNPTVFEDHNTGTGKALRRKFCGDCGSNLIEDGENNNDFVYIVWGTLDDPNALPPKGEFFCKSKAPWLPDFPGLFSKKEVKE